jgi:competence protein ComEC
LTLIFFQQLSLVGFVANLIAIPVITLGVTPLALLGIVFAPLWQVASWILGALMALLQALAAWPAAVWSAAAAPVWAAVAGLAGGALAVLPLPWRLRACAVPLMLPLLAPPITRPAEGQFELVAADIGQGTAVLVRTRSHLLVYDAGPQLGAQSDAGSRVLVPLLRARGERRIDLLMLSHRDADHVGGAAALMAAVAVGELSSSLEPVHPLLASAAGSRPHRRCDAGQRWTWDGVAFEVLHPRAEDHFPGADVKVKPNALSCVLRIVDRNGRSALLTGDIEAAQELALVQREAAALKVELLLVPHHGSRTSSTSAFLDAVAPRTAIVQAAYRSRFGHPAPDVLARYAARGIAVQRSDRCGAFTWAADGGARCEREAARRYWHHRDAEPPAGGTPGAERR